MIKQFKHSVKKDNIRPLALTVTYSGHQRCAPSHRWGAGVRQQYILHLIISGKGTYTTPHGTFSLQKGDIFLIRPFTEIEYCADSSDPWEYCWVNFTGPDADIVLSRTDFTHICPVMHKCGDDITNAMMDILAVSGSSEYESIHLTSMLYELLALLVRNSDSSSHDYASSRCVRTALDYIAQNYPLPISVEDIAAAAAVSRTTLFRVFKSELGISPAEFLIEYRIKQAQKLLSATDLSVSAVSRSSGYEDSAYFSRAFKKITGISPTEYKEKSHSR